MAEMLISMVIFSAISLALMMGFTTLERNYAATQDFALNHGDEMRISDYMALDLRRATAVATSRTVIGVMTPSIWRVATLPAVDDDGGADTTAGTSASTPRAVTPRSAAIRPGLIRLPIGAAAA